jgi:hypothetical protein
MGTKNTANLSFSYVAASQWQEGDKAQAGPVTKGHKEKKDRSGEEREKQEGKGGA